MEDKKGEVPITERSNPLTFDVDTADSKGIVEKIARCDLEIFTGWQNYKDLLDDDIICSISFTALCVADIIKNPGTNLIVMSGCGTSGRLAFFTCRNINRYLKECGVPPCCTYLIAGGDNALFMSIEAQEDDPHLGAKQLEDLCQSAEKVLYIGITCGLSAAYIAGQLDHCLQHLDKFIPVVIGFNPVNLARKQPIEKWDKTCYSVILNLQEAAQQGRAAILNPILGPEPITGSSRMKGGSATKVLLDVVFHTALVHINNITQKQNFVRSVLRLLHDVLQGYFDQVCKSQVADVVGSAGKSLNSDGHIYYVGEDSLGILGVIDASECPPTFGATFQDVRGFIQGGFHVLNNQEGALEQMSKSRNFSTEAFLANILPTVTEFDTVIFIDADLFSSVKNEVRQTSAKTVLIKTTKGSGTEDTEMTKIIISLPEEPFKNLAEKFNIPSHLLQLIKQNSVELCVKCVLNIISTGAHILKGKVLNNYMIDLKLSNSKLFKRGVGIVMRFTGCQESEATKAVLKAIYESDDLSCDQKNAPISSHILLAAKTAKVIPTAILVLSKNCSIQQARETLIRHPVLRLAISSMVT